jgi:rhamnulose-1-phosphate aldolase
MHLTENSWFVKALVKATSDMWSKGWNERNGGNITLRLLDADVEPYLPSWSVSRRLPLGDALPELAGQYFIITGSGKYFRNVQLDPEENLGVFRIADDGASSEILWGLSDGGVPTSELPSHLKSHLARQQLLGEKQRVIMHCHATNLIALSYVLQFDTANLTRALWEGSTECLVVFPEGVAALEWMAPGTDEIGDATAVLMAQHPLVLWQFHGVFGAGRTLDETFGLIDTAEKSAEILVKQISMGGPFRSITSENLAALAKRFGVSPLPEAMLANGWRLGEPRGAHTVSAGAGGVGPRSSADGMGRCRIRS